MNKFYECLSQTNYIQQPLPPFSRTGAGGANGQSGALGAGQQMSTGLITFYQFWFVHSSCCQSPNRGFFQGLYLSNCRRIYC
jgi:hypothetical protein